MNELKMPQSSSRPTSPGPIGVNMKYPHGQLVMVKTEMGNQKVADGAMSPIERRDETSVNQNTCDIPVKTEINPNTGSSIEVVKKHCERSTDTDDNRTSQTKVPNAPRSKLIYSCHRCKLIFNSRITFELHYKYDLMHYWRSFFFGWNLIDSFRIAFFPCLFFFLFRAQGNV